MTGRFVARHRCHQLLAENFSDMLQKRHAGSRVRAIIVGSGPTAAGFVPTDGVMVIAVYGTIGQLSRIKYFFTIDPGPANLYRPGNLVPRGSPVWWLWRWSSVKGLRASVPDTFIPVIALMARWAWLFTRV